MRSGGPCTTAPNGANCPPTSGPPLGPARGAPPVRLTLADQGAPGRPRAPWRCGRPTCSVAGARDPVQLAYRLGTRFLRSAASDDQIHCRVPWDPPSFFEALDQGVGARIWDLLLETIGTPFHQAFECVRETGQPASFEHRHAAQDRWYRLARARRCCPTNSSSREPSTVRTGSWPSSRSGPATISRPRRRGSNSRRWSASRSWRSSTCVRWISRSTRRWWR